MLHLPSNGITIKRMEPIKQRCKPYFLPLEGDCNDEYPMSKIIDMYIKSVSTPISHFLEVSRRERKNLIHTRLFYPIVRLVDGGNM